MVEGYDILSVRVVARAGILPATWMIDTRLGIIQCMGVDLVKMGCS